MRGLTRNRSTRRLNHWSPQPQDATPCQSRGVTSRDTWCHLGLKGWLWSEDMCCASSRVILTCLCRVNADRNICILLVHVGRWRRGWLSMTYYRRWRSMTPYPSRTLDGHLLQLFVPITGSHRVDSDRKNRLIALWVSTWKSCSHLYVNWAGDWRNHKNVRLWCYRMVSCVRLYTHTAHEHDKEFVPRCRYTFPRHCPRHGFTFHYPVPLRQQSSAAFRNLCK